jgi:hypothetical protein
MSGQPVIPLILVKNVKNIHKKVKRGAAASQNDKNSALAGESVFVLSLTRAT